MNNSDENPQMNGREIHNTEINSNNNLAIIGFVLSLLVPLAGLIVSIIGLKKSKEMHDNGRGFAIAGIIISSIFLGFGLLFTIAFLLLFVGSFMVVENAIEKNVDYIDENQDNYAMCDYAYDCELDSDGMYSCKYENEYGEEVDISCYYDKNEFDLSSAIIGDWVPFLVEKDGENITVDEYYGTEVINRYINFSIDTFIDYTNNSSDIEISGTYEIIDNTITLNYYDGEVKHIDVDVYGNNNINLTLYDGNAKVFFS